MNIMDDLLVDLLPLLDVLLMNEIEARCIPRGNSLPTRRTSKNICLQTWFKLSLIFSIHLGASRCITSTIVKHRYHIRILLMHIGAELLFSRYTDRGSGCYLLTPSKIGGCVLGTSCNMRLYPQKNKKYLIWWSKSFL